MCQPQNCILCHALKRPHASAAKGRGDQGKASGLIGIGLIRLGLIRLGLIRLGLFGIGLFGIGLATVAAALLVVTGCAVSNEATAERVYAPNISGVIYKSGVPQEGLSVIVSLIDGEADLCYFSMLQSTTDQAGEFKLGPITRELAGVHRGDYENHWQVCIEQEGQRLGIWSDSQVGALLLPSVSRLECDLAKKPGSICAELF